MSYARIIIVYFTVFFMTVIPSFTLGQQYPCQTGFRGNFTPIWTMYGNIDPYSRPTMQPHWNRYSNVLGIQPGVVYQPMIRQPILGQPILNGTIIGESNVETDVVAPGAAVDRNLNQRGLQNQVPDSVIQSIESLVPAGDQPDESLLDSQDSSSDVALDATAEVETKNSFHAEIELSRRENEQLRDQLLKRDQQLAELEAKMKDMAMLAEQFESRAQRLEKEFVHVTEEKKKMIEEAVRKTKKESAWEISKIRSEAESAKSELINQRKKAGIERENLLKRLKSVEFKLKEAAEHSVGEDNKKPVIRNANRANKEPMTLAEMANEKRRLRTAGEAKQAEPELPDTAKTEMDKQLGRALAKIKRRFDAKIKRAKESEDALATIAKLKKEMKIQMEKMEERIRNRFKNRQQ